MRGTKRFRSGSPPDISDDNVKQNMSKKGHGNDVQKDETPQCRAARGRREKEYELMALLADTLPVPKNVSAKLDKASILRMAVSYIKMKKLFHTERSEAMQEFLLNNGAGVQEQPVNNTDSSETNNGHNGHHHQGDSHNLHNISNSIKEADLMLKSLYGFVLFVSRKGEIYYVSDQATQHLGINPEDLIGKSIYGFLHKDDCTEFYRQFKGHPTCKEDVCKRSSLFPQNESPIVYNMDYEDDDDEDDEVDPRCYVCERLFYARMRCHIHKQGVKNRQTGFMLMQFSGRVRLEKRRVIGMTLICRPMQSTPIIEIRLDGSMFMSRHSLDLKFTFIDPRILTHVGYEPAELVGKTAYQFHNPTDAQKCLSCHDTLIAKGTAVSKYYRFLGKTGVWVWMQTRATIIYNTGNKPQYVVCMNYIIGEEEGRRYLMMEQEQDMKAGSDPGFINITSIPNSPSSPDTGYVSGSDYEHPSPESLSPALLSPVASTQDTNALVGGDSGFAGNSGGLDDIFSPSFTDDFRLPHSLDMALSSSVTESINTMVPVPPNHVLPAKVNVNTKDSYLGKNMMQFSDVFNMVDMEVDQGSEKNITFTLPAETCQEDQGLSQVSAHILDVLKTLPSQGAGQPTIQISIETTNAKSQKPQVSLSNFGQQNLSSTSNNTGKNIHGASNASVSVMDTGMMSPHNDTMMETSLDIPVSKFKESNVTSSFDLFNGRDLDSEMLNYDVLGLSDSVINDTLSENLLNDVSLGTSVDTVSVPSISSTRTNVQYTTTIQKPVSSPRKSSLSSVNKYSIHQNNMSCKNTLNNNNPNSFHVYPSVGNNSTKKVVHHNGTNTASTRYSHDSHKYDFEAAKRGLGDHTYTAVCPSRNNENKKFAPSSRTKKREIHEGTLLEHFLTTTKPLNPMRGSDCVAQSISKLKIEDNNHQGGSKRTQKPTILKKLLTEETIESETVSHISSSNPATSATTSATIGSVISEHSSELSPVYGEPSVTDLSILDAGPDIDESVWNDISKQDTDELCLSSDINEILEQENWLEEEWMKHFLEKLY